MHQNIFKVLSAFLKQWNGVEKLKPVDEGMGGGGGAKIPITFVAL